MTAEGDVEVPAFTLWLPVFEDCLKLQEEFYQHEAVDWAKKKGRWMSTKSLIICLCGLSPAGCPD